MAVASVIMQLSCLSDSVPNRILVVGISRPAMRFIFDGFGQSDPYTLSLAWITELGEGTDRTERVSKDH